MMYGNMTNADGENVDRVMEEAAEQLKASC